MSGTPTRSAAVRAETAAPAPGGWGGANRLSAAAAVSALGNGVRIAALPLLAVTYTTDPALLALLTAAGTLPTLASPLAGAAADRWRRRALMVRIDLARALIVALLAVLVLTGASDLALLCAMAFLLGLGEVVFVVTAQTFLPEVVDSSKLTAANGRLQAVQLIFLNTLGQPLGGLLFSAAAALPFLVDSASFAVGVLILLTVHAVTATATGPADAPAPDRPGWGSMVREGYRHLRGDRLLMLLAVMLGVVNFFYVGIMAVFVLYVLKVLGLGKTAYGLFLAVAALGGLAGGLTAARLRNRLGTFGAVSAALALLGASCLVMGLAHAVPIAVAGFFALNFAAVVYQALTVAFRQTAAPRELIGRINGVYRLFGTGSAPLGAVAAGMVAGQSTISTPFTVGGAALVLLAAGTAGPLARMGRLRAGERG